MAEEGVQHTRCASPLQVLEFVINSDAQSAVIKGILQIAEAGQQDRIANEG
ncbi:hypothetical protein D3C76_1881670 [compost metagenome]